MNVQSSSGPEPVSDSFERPELGSDWAIYNGDVGIVGGKDLGLLTKDGPMKGLGIVAWCAGDLAVDQFSEAVLAQDLDSKALPQVFVRRHPSDGRRYAFHWNTAEGGRWELKLDGGPDTAVLAMAASSRFSPGDTMRIEAAGSTITAFHNGVEVLSAEDSALGTPAEAGQPGMAFNVARGVELFPAPFISSWTGGSLPPCRE